MNHAETLLETKLTLEDILETNAKAFYKTYNKYDRQFINGINTYIKNKISEYSRFNLPLTDYTSDTLDNLLGVLEEHEAYLDDTANEYIPY